MLFAEEAPEHHHNKMDRPVVARATSSDDSPTPGYLYGDIAQMTHANFEGCRQLTVYLLERIKKPNHNIKFKCLQIIKVIHSPSAVSTRLGSELQNIHLRRRGVSRHARQCVRSRARFRGSQGEARLVRTMEECVVLLRRNGSRRPTRMAPSIADVQSAVHTGCIHLANQSKSEPVSNQTVSTPSRVSAVFSVDCDIVL